MALSAGYLTARSPELALTALSRLEVFKLRPELNIPEYTPVLLLYFTRILSIKVALLCVIHVGMVIFGTAEFVNFEYNKFVVGICVSVLRQTSCVAVLT